MTLSIDIQFERNVLHSETFRLVLIAKKYEMNDITLILSMYEATRINLYNLSITTSLLKKMQYKSHQTNQVLINSHATQRNNLHKS